MLALARSKPAHAATRKVNPVFFLLSTVADPEYLELPLLCACYQDLLLTLMLPTSSVFDSPNVAPLEIFVRPTREARDSIRCPAFTAQRIESLTI